jgi:signal transduction histidine kinase
MTDQDLTEKQVESHPKSGHLSQKQQPYQQMQQLNAELEQQVQERTAQLQQALEFEALLKRITDKVRDSLDEEQILQAAVEELGAGLAVESCDTGIYNTDFTTCTIAHEYTATIEPIPGHVLSMAEFPELFPYLLRGECLQYCPTSLSQVHSDLKHTSVLACPIVVPNHAESDTQNVLGDLCLFKKSEEIFNELEVRLVQQVANQCAIAIRQSRLYQTAQNQVQELENLNRLKDTFLSTVSHELRTPITNIKMATQMLEVKLQQVGILNDDSGIMRYLQILRDECDREMSLVNNLLDLSQLEAETKPLRLSSTRLQDWIPYLVEPFQERAQKQQQHFQMHFPSELPPVQTELSMLKRIAIELLDNACKYTPKGERIWILAQTSSEALELHVGNSGVEIPEAERSRIFDKFYRILHADPYKHGGTGLGLALVKKLTAQIGATIQVTSCSNETTFTLTLPFASNLTSSRSDLS